MANIPTWMKEKLVKLQNKKLPSVDAVKVEIAQEKTAGYIFGLPSRLIVEVDGVDYQIGSARDLDISIHMEDAISVKTELLVNEIYCVELRKNSDAPNVFQSWGRCMITEGWE